MRHRHAYSLFEIVITISLVALLILLLLPALGRSRGRSATQMQNNTQTRGIQSSLVLYASGNNTYYVGRDSQGTVTDATVEGRLQTLLEAGYFTGEYLVSPKDVISAWTTGALDRSQYSYALLDISSPGQTPDDPSLSRRRLDEWKDTINTESVVISDRNIGAAKPEQYQSVWTTDPGEWRGSVAWNDNHVTFEATASELRTKYGRTSNAGDDIFQAEGPSDSLMIHVGR